MVPRVTQSASCCVEFMELFQTGVSYGQRAFVFTILKLEGTQEHVGKQAGPGACRWVRTGKQRHLQAERTDPGGSLGCAVGVRERRAELADP